MEADLRLLKKKLSRADAEISGLKSEETRLIIANKSLKKAAEKHQKEAHRLLFFMNKKERSVSSTENKNAKYFRVMKFKFEKVMKDNRTFEKVNKILKTEN